MDYNQQRRSRNNGYANHGFNNSGPYYGRQMNYARNQNAAKEECGCGLSQAPGDCERSSQKDTVCEWNRETSYEIGMAYVPWQSWKRTYDGSRGLMSGTIFPELDKPFCAAGRCGR